MTLKKWWKEPKRKKEVSKKIAKTLKQTLKEKKKKISDYPLAVQVLKSEAFKKQAKIRFRDAHWSCQEPGCTYKTHWSKKVHGLNWLITSNINRTLKKYEIENSYHIEVDKNIWNEMFGKVLCDKHFKSIQTSLEPHQNVLL